MRRACIVAITLRVMNNRLTLFAIAHVRKGVEIHHAERDGYYASPAA
jgi:hypothetical protein